MSVHGRGMHRGRHLARLASAMVLTMGVVLALAPTGAGAQNGKAGCPTGGKGPVSLSALYKVDICVRDVDDYIDVPLASAMQSAQSCSQEPPSGDASIGQGMTSRAMTDQELVASWTPGATAYLAAEGKWYAKRKKGDPPKEAKLAGRIVGAIATIAPIVSAKSTADTSFDSDMSTAGSAFTSQNCAQAQASLDQAAVDQKTAEADTLKFADAIQALVLLLGAK
jgi:hypothetical protein